MDALTDLRARLQATLSDRYTLERELSGGGMSRVFVATERALGREVVIKILAPELTAAISFERFRREIQLAAQLQHPHIVPLLAAGESDGLPYFAMPYVRGESLRARLTEAGALPLPEALRILRGVASALAYAHAHGVVHRDIKPENVLLSDGVAVVTDFGVAKALTVSTGPHPGAPGDSAPGAASSGLTTAGVALGTPAYMAPEQVAADPQLDQRVDIYAFGILAYELLTGKTPFADRAPGAMFAAHLVEVPESVGARRAGGVAPALELLVMRCLAKHPAERPQTADDLVASLDAITTGGTTAPFLSGRSMRSWSTPARRKRNLLAVGAAALVLALGGVIGRGYTRSRAAAAPIRLAVLPFDNIGDPADAYLADGVTFAVRDKLAALPGLEVIASQSSQQYRRSTKTPREIGRELGVSHILVGRVRWAKEAGQSRVQVSPELVQVATAVRIWGAPFDEPLTDVFRVQSEIAGRVVEALGVALSERAKRRLDTRPTASLAAYDAYLKGEAAANSLADVSKAELDRATAFYERAVDLDSTFAPAWTQIARAHSLQFFQGSIVGHAEPARQAAERARALAPARPETYLALGDYYLKVLQDNRRALAEFATGLRIAPANADLLTGSALAEQGLGRWDDALDHFQQAQASDPRAVTTARRLAQLYLWLRRYPEAAAASDRALVLAPANLNALQVRAMIFLAQGDLAEARSILRRAPPNVDPDEFLGFMATFWNLYWVLDDAQQRRVLSLSPAAFGGERTGWASVLAATYQVRGDEARSRAYADSARIAREAELRATPQADANSHVELGLNLAYLGRKADAMREGERAVEMQGIDTDAYSGAYNQHALVRIYLLVGEPEKALDRLEPLLRMPYLLSPGWLRVDPTFAPLRGHPRFEKLASGG